jgi:LPS-assembly protein
MRKNTTILIAMLLATDPAYAQNNAIIMRGDAMTYDQDKSLATARGNVEIVRDSSILIADEVSYDKEADLLNARGNVSILDAEENTFFAKTVVLKRNMENGIIDGFQARLKDNSLFAAEKATIISKNVYGLERAVYSPCPVCKGKRIMWQIKSDHVTYDKEKKKITYRKAIFEVFNIPVLYFPYFSHATAQGDRRSGFLIPKQGSSSQIGRYIKFPFYLNIAPNKEATISPTFTTKGGTILQGKYTHLTRLGTYNIEASGVKTNKQKAINYNPPYNHPYRHHIHLHGDFNLDPKWKAKVNYKKASDKTYLREYNISGEDYLRSIATLEYLSANDYANFNSLYFQGLRPEDDTQTAPFILPLIDSYIEKDASYGSKVSLTSNFLSIMRHIGASSNRISLKGEWRLPFVTENGHLMSLSSSVRTSLYYIDKKNLDHFLKPYYTGLAIPEVKLDWRFPLAKVIDNNTFLVEPIVNLILSPYKKSNQKILNEDSRFAEISEQNLFNSNHFPGLDRIETGPRSSYGISASYIDHKLGTISARFGQSYRVYADPALDIRSGMHGNFSDYVGRIGFAPNQILDLVYRLRLNKKDLSIRKNEAIANIKLNKINLHMNYITFSDIIPEREFATSTRQLYGHANIWLNEKWRVGPYVRLDLRDKKVVLAEDKTRNRILNAGGVLTYEGDCVSATYSINRDYTKDLRINRKPGITQSVTFSLKNLTQ